MRKLIGCGCGVVLAIILIISLVGWALTFMDGSSPIRQFKAIPSDVPPAGGQAVESIDVHAPGRTADMLVDWAGPLAAETDIPPAALRAYANAELIAAQSWPECHLRWNTLAGIGYVETRHGTYSGHLFSSQSIDDKGYALPPIIGVALDGSPGFADVADTDNGELDGDSEHDRAVGPMQFIPESWKRYGRDANGDGYPDPNQIDDAALTAANLLCQGRDLSTPEGWAGAIAAYNQSEQYLIDVRNAAAAYAIPQPAI